MGYFWGVFFTVFIDYVQFYVQPSRSDFFKYFTNKDDIDII